MSMCSCNIWPLTFHILKVELGFTSFFHLKIIFLTAVKYCSILHERVIETLLEIH